MKKLIEFIEKALDWSGKFFNRIKGLGYLVALIVFIIFFINHGCQKSHAKELLERITGLDIRNDLLLEDNKRLDDSLKADALRITALKESQQILIAEKSKLKKDNAKMRETIARIPNWILNLPADSSYAFLNNIAYPFPGEKKYPFNEPQVKNIHADFMENIELTGLVRNLEDQLVNCEKYSAVNDTMSKIHQKSYATASKKVENLEGVVSNQNEKVAMLEKEVNKNNRGKKFWKVTAIVTSALALILVL